MERERVRGRRIYMEKQIDTRHTQKEEDKKERRARGKKMTRVFCMLESVRQGRRQRSK